MYVCRLNGRIAIAVVVVAAAFAADRVSPLAYQLSRVTETAAFWSLDADGSIPAWEVQKQNKVPPPPLILSISKELTMLMFRVPMASAVNAAAARLQPLIGSTNQTVGRRTVLHHVSCEGRATPLMCSRGIFTESYTGVDKWRERRSKFRARNKDAGEGRRVLNRLRGKFEEGGVHALKNRDIDVVLDAAETEADLRLAVEVLKYATFKLIHAFVQILVHRLLLGRLFVIPRTRSASSSSSSRAFSNWQRSCRCPTWPGKCGPIQKL